MNITDPIRQHAGDGTDAPAVVTRRQVIGYPQLDRTLDRLAERALDAGIGPGDVAAIVFSTQYESFALALALARIGAAAVVTNDAAERVKATFVRRGSGIATSGRVITVDDDGFAIAPEETQGRVIASHPDADAVCRIFWTSGTSGTPKGVALTHAMLAHRIRMKNAALPLPPAVRLLCPMGAVGGYGFRDLVRTLWAGGTIVLKQGGDDLAALIVEHRVSYLLAPPATLLGLVEKIPPGTHAFPSLAMVESGGSPMSPHLYEAARERVCPTIVASYGSTESGSIACAPMAGIVGRPGVVGHPMHGIEVRIVDDDGRPVPPGTDGIVCVRGDTCVTSYVDDEEATRRAFQDGWFRPGDLGRLDADGMLVIAGRQDERMNIGGSKVLPESIERVVLDLPGIIDAAAFAYRSPLGIDRVAVAIVAGPTLDFAAFRERCERELGVFSPEIVLRMASLPRNENGKVMRQALLALLPRGTGDAVRTQP
jgi:acyl-coenzyme A synthetase/AMP-(fatty) acid ligase